MTDTEYRDNLDLLLSLLHGQAAILVGIPLDEMIERGERALNLGPFVQPTLWIQQHKALEQDLEFMRMLQPVRDFLVAIHTQETL